MKIFFGKISDKYDVNQIEEGYYHAPRNSSWFNGIDIGDYAFIIGGGRIQLWRAREWTNLSTQNERLEFEILSKNLGIRIEDLVRFKHFTLSVDLIVKTTRSTAMEKKAFFPIRYDRDFTEENLRSLEIYTLPEYFRGIYIYNSNPGINDSYDLVFYFENNRLRLSQIKNADPAITSKFIPDNINYHGRGAVQKDKTLTIFLTEQYRGKDISDKLGIKDIYDSLMCPYKIPDKTPQYWVLNGLDDERIEYCLENSVFIMQYQYGVQNSSQVTIHLNLVKKIKEGDKVLLFNKNKYFASGTVSRVTISGTKNFNITQQVQQNIRHDLGEVVTYTDAPCYYEDLNDSNGFNGEFGQRISIEEWENINEDGVIVPGIREHVDFVQNTIMPIKDSQFFNMINSILSGDFPNSLEFNKFNVFISTLEYKKQVVLQGPPGTGKTLLAKDIAEFLIYSSVSKDKKVQKLNLETSSQFRLVQFHPGYTYEDFIRGIVSTVNGNFIEYTTKNKLLGEFIELAVQNHDKKFVLVVDEINRANLSSVLGELIYALEYRGEFVESMYSINGSNKLVLPLNLYIIGTMNTADRSVGQIDYAIRRRFAFIDVLPKDLTPELGDGFAKNLYEKVSKMFDYSTFLSKEFKAKDVQLGHSYFIIRNNEGGSIDVRLEYEIKPILREYVKDGILVGEEEELEAYIGSLSN